MRTSWLWIAFVLVIIGLIATPFIPYPLMINEQIGDTQVDIRGERAWVALPIDCTTLRWQIDNIQAVFVNGESSVGEGQQEVCPGERAITEFQVILPDGSEQTYTAQIRLLTQTTIYLIGVGIAGLLLVIGIGMSAIHGMGSEGRATVRLLRAIELTAIYLIVSLLLLEGLMRVWIGVTGTERDRLLYMGSEAEIDLALRSHIPLPYLNYGLSPELEDVNALGYRSGEVTIPKPTGTYRIVTLGGSTTYGDQLPAAESWPTQLEQMLRDDYGHNQVEVINAGVRGYTTWNSLVNLQFRLLELEPDLIIVYHAINDAWGMVLFNPECYRGMNPLRGLDKGLTFDFESDVNLGPSTLWRYVGLRFGFLDDPTGNVTFDTFITEDCKPSVSGDALLDMNPPDLFERNLEHIALTADHHNVDVLLSSWVFYQPEDDSETEESLANVPWFAKTRQLNEVAETIAESFNLHFVDLVQLMEISQREFFQGDGYHQTAAGNHNQAEVYAEYIDREILQER